MLETAATYGDRAMEFIWKNKKSLAVAVALTAFLADPKPFIEGGKDLAEVVAANTVKPLAVASGQAMNEAAQRTKWTLVAICTVGVIGILVGVKYLFRRKYVPWNLATSRGSERESSSN